MKVSKEKLAEHRSAMIQAAGQLFRERGIDGVGVAEICKAAGLTHGALYAQFGSRQGLMAEALKDGMAASNDRMLKRGKGRAAPLAAYVDSYLSTKHRDDLGGGCSIAALASDVGRQDAIVGASFADGLARGIDGVTARLPNVAPKKRQARAMAIISLLSGAVAASRAVVKADPALADHILAAARDAVDRLTA
jgi:TetR/AcrR family transcriptional regulator, transcriptional repressor for nem operon